MSVPLALVAADAKRSCRDPFLAMMLLYPWIFALALRFALPPLGKRFAGTVDIAAFHPLAACLVAVLLPFSLGLVLGFHLLEEKETGFLAAVAVTPTSVGRYFAVRAGIYGSFGVGLLILVHEAFSLVEVPLGLLVVVSVGAAPTVPLMALVLASFASDQVEGFAIMKGSGILLMGPLASTFLPGSWQWAVGVLPTFWPIQAYFLAAEGRVGATLAAAAVALAFQGTVAARLRDRFVARVAS